MLVWELSGHNAEGEHMPIGIFSTQDLAVSFIIDHKNHFPEEPEVGYTLRVTPYVLDEPCSHDPRLIEWEGMYKGIHNTVIKSYQYDIKGKEIPFKEWWLET